MNAKLMRIVLGAASLGISCVFLGIAAFIWFSPGPAEGRAANFQSAVEQEPWGIDGGWSEVSLYEAAWIDMNEAMREGDRELFLSHAEGDAAEQLALWWDNTKLIGWDLGYIVPSETEEGAETAEIGVVFPFPSQPLRGSGEDDAGLTVTTNMSYEIETEGEGDDLVITSFAPAGQPAPWDTGSLYVQKRDHVVLFGDESEQDVVDAQIDIAEEAAVLALDTAAELGAEVPQKGFVAAVTRDEARFAEWHIGGLETAPNVRTLGFARITTRLLFPVDLIDPSIATGDARAGGFVMVGPMADDDLKRVYVHEFSHVLHYAAVPDYSLFGDSPSALEGFAHYMEVATGASDQVFVSQRLKAYVAQYGAGALQPENFENENGPIAYDAAASFYQFVAENGGDPWELAVEAKATQLGASEHRTVADVSGDANPELNADAWIAWVAAQ